MVTALASPHPPQKSGLVLIPACRKHHGEAYDQEPQLTFRPHRRAGHHHHHHGPGYKIFAKKWVRRRRFQANPFDRSQPVQQFQLVFRLGMKQGSLYGDFVVTEGSRSCIHI
jgi:hypothetical protein